MEEIAVIITIQSLQILETGREAMTQHARGTLCREGEEWLLTYREEDSGLGDTRTALRVGQDRAELTRTGEVASHMVFQRGKAHTSLYETPYGQLPMTVRALAVKNDLGDRGGHVAIHYQIQLGGAAAGETRLRLTVQAKEREL